MDIDISGKVNTQDAKQVTQRYLIQISNSLVFPIGIDNVKGLNSQGLSFRKKLVYDNQAIALSGGTVKLTLSQSGDFRFEVESKSGGTNLEALKNYIVVVEHQQTSLIMVLS